MTEPARKTRPRKPEALTIATPPPLPVPDPAPRTCNLAGCPEMPEWRGLCAAHRQTHRGLADETER